MIRWCAFAAVTMQPGNPFPSFSYFGGILYAAHVHLCSALHVFGFPPGCRKKQMGTVASRACDPNGPNSLYTPSHTHTLSRLCMYVRIPNNYKGDQTGKKIKTHRLHMFSKDPRNSRPSGNTHVAVGPPHTWQTLLVTFARNGRTPSFFLFLGDVSDFPNVQDSQDCYRRICGEYRTYINATATHNVFQLSMSGY